jgi:membrane-associated phospholipid phosphatase
MPAHDVSTRVGEGPRRQGRRATTTAAVPSARTAAGADTAARADRAVHVQAALLQLVVLLWCYALYDILRTAVSGTFGTAVANAGHITSLERAAGLNLEGTLQRAVLQLPWLVDLCNVCYSLTHLLAPPLVLVVLYRKAPARYRVARNAFLALLGLALLAFWLLPVGPPRLVPGPTHLTDTSQNLSLDHTPLAGVVATKNESAAPAWLGSTNPFAAMPSLHVGWAVWVALALWPILRRRSTKILAATYPAWMLLSVVVTGNHWLLDGVAGAVLAAIAAGAAAEWERRRARAPRRGLTGAPAVTA